MGLWGPAAGGGGQISPPLDGELALASHWVVMEGFLDSLLPYCFVGFFIALGVLAIFGKGGGGDTSD